MRQPRRAASVLTAVALVVASMLTGAQPVSAHHGSSGNWHVTSVVGGVNTFQTKELLFEVQGPGGCDMFVIARSYTPGIETSAHTRSADWIVRPDVPTAQCTFEFQVTVRCDKQVTGGGHFDCPHLSNEQPQRTSGWHAWNPDVYREPDSGLGGGWGPPFPPLHGEHMLVALQVRVVSDGHTSPAYTSLPGQDTTMSYTGGQTK